MSSEAGDRPSCREVDPVRLGKETWPLLSMVPVSYSGAVARRAGAAANIGGGLL
jgi:hypothetical protein